MDIDTSTRLEIPLQSEQLKLIEEFQRAEALLSREASVIQLLEIALEVVTGTGNRFWDKSPARSVDEPPRR